METSTFDWSCRNTWLQSAKNTSWCLLGCSIGDFGTILFFQLTKIPLPVLAIMVLAIINGLITSIILETIILIRQDLEFNKALRTAMGMSFISMISMETTTKHSSRGGRAPQICFRWIPSGVRQCSKILNSNYRNRGRPDGRPSI